MSTSQCVWSDHSRTLAFNRQHHPSALQAPTYPTERRQSNQQLFVLSEAISPIHRAFHIATTKVSSSTKRSHNLVLIHCMSLSIHKTTIIMLLGFAKSGEKLNLFKILYNAFC